MINKLMQLIALFHTILRLSFTKIFHSNFKFHLFSFIHPLVSMKIEYNTNVQFGKFIRIKNGTKINIRKNSTFKIGQNTALNYNCIVVCREKIIIGSNVQIGPNVLIYDHDHEYRTLQGLRNLDYNTKPIIIGDNVWIGANTILLKGTEIGDNSVIAAGSIVKSKVDTNSILIQKRNKEIKKIMRKQK